MTGSTWNYWRPAAAEIELCAVSGRDVGLPPQFHDEDQFTFVVSGRRRFVIGDRLVVVPAGTSTVIPAGVPHSSLAEPAGVECLNAYLPAGEGDEAAMAAALRRHPRVADAAAQVGMSREGYSRAFAARHGMPPGAYRRAASLNAARALLREGEGIAAAAAATGFADQSHLGRWFRRAFGTTPGRYRRGPVRSQPF